MAKILREPKEHEVMCIEEKPTWAGRKNLADSMGVVWNEEKGSSGARGRSCEVSEHKRPLRTGGRIRHMIQLQVLATDDSGTVHPDILVKVELCDVEMIVTELLEFLPKLATQ